MTQQELVNQAVKRCYDEYAKHPGEHRSAKEYTKSWFEFAWKDVSMAQLDMAVQKMEG